VILTIAESVAAAVAEPGTRGCWIALGNSEAGSTGNAFAPGVEAFVWTVRPPCTARAADATPRRLFHSPYGVSRVVVMVGML